MKDIPLFTASNGMASLILQEIPYRGEAYIWVRSVFGSLDGLLQECIGFCHAAGAQQVYFSGQGDFSAYAVHTRLIERSIAKAALPGTPARALPASDTAKWLRLYRQRFRHVPAARSTPKSEGLYDIFLERQQIGIAQCSGSALQSVASLERGCGAACVCAIAAQIQGERISLLCAEENLPAMKLYDKLGFTRDHCKEVWYCMK